MEVKVKSQHRPQYYEKNGICILISGIMFVRKMENPYGCGNTSDFKGVVEVGISTAQYNSMPMIIPISCKNTEEQESIYVQLTTLLMLL